jgi:WS/DGAT/MGAT family acyltransferase
LKRLKLLDAAWLYVETRQMPMHVAALLILSLPEDAQADYLLQRIAYLRTQRSFVAPWNLRLRPSPLRGVLPAWETDESPDLDYHIRHLALPRPGGERELGVLVSSLHSHELDWDRPLWEFHLIEGLDHGRFALYVKMHHAQIDGVAAMRVMQRVLTHQPQLWPTAPWSVAPVTPRAPDAPPPPRPSLRERIGALPLALRAVAEAWRAQRYGAFLVAPFSAPQSVLNQRITAPRRFATQHYQTARLVKLARQHDVTQNDIVLAVCAAALRRFLSESGVLPDEPLIACVPFAIRRETQAAVGTSISFVLVNLGTHLDDPLKRLALIHRSSSAAKAHLQSLPQSALDTYTALFMSPYLASQLTGVAGHGRPMFNITISNVPGSRHPLWFGSARLEGLYPVSVLLQGQALNITCLNYHDRLLFGFVGCRDALPHMQRLAVYTGEALKELEKQRGPRRRRAAAH